ncbi:MAG: hypothetical protein AAF725_26710 [Acidobacteriota bacterium]
MLGVLAVGLALFSLTLFGRLEEARRLAPPPLESKSILQATPLGQGTRQLESADSAALRVPREGGAQMLYLSTRDLLGPGDGRATSYRATLRHVESGERWLLESLEPDGAGGFTVLLNPSTLPAGAFRLRILRIEGDGDLSEVEEYALELKPPEAGHE